MKWIDCNEEPIPELPLNVWKVCCVALIKRHSEQVPGFYSIITMKVYYDKRKGWSTRGNEEILYYIIIPDLPRAPFEELIKYMSVHFPDLPL